MNTFLAALQPRRILGVVAVLAALGVAASLPAFWLRWELDGARDKAGLVAEAEAARVQTALSGLLGRFERATASLRSQDLSGDAVALTGRLLRTEPLVAPAAGLSVINGRGQQVASSSMSNGPGGAPPWWFRSQPLPPPGQVALLGCGAQGVETLGWALVRSIEGAADAAVGQVSSTLSDATLRSLVLPGAGSASIALRTASGCEALRAETAPAGWQPASLLPAWYLRLLPADWLDVGSAVATAKAGNLAVAATVSPGTMLAAQHAALERRGGTVMTATAALSGLVSLLGLLAVARRGTPRIRIERPTPPAAAPDDAVQAEREAARRELAEMAGERDRVLAAIGHDVRTPINSILGICALLMDGDLAEPQRRWLKRIRASCEALLAMLNGMLEMAAARVDGGSIHLEAIDVGALVEEVGDVLRPQAEDKGLELTVALDESVLGAWNTDATRLRQVLFNLCGNAIKYTVRGSVEVSASAAKAEDGTHLLRLQVTDTGFGIADSERETIFQQFKRGRDEVSRGQEGVGLGLALCREIAGLLGGTLTLDSTVGVGSSFGFEIPVQRAGCGSAKGGPLAGRSALVVGLSEGVRRRVAFHLEGMGLEVETAGDGFLAVGLAERIAYRHGTLDLMVLDAALPGLSAEALLARLQGNRSLDRLRTVLVANGSVAAAAEGRADAVVSHPVETRELEAAIATLFGDRSVLQEIYPRGPAAPRSRVLVVEDNRINQALFIDQLTRAGFSAFAASNGREAVEAVQRGGFDGILMDLQMPEVDGIEATRRIRAAEAGGPGVPIIGMTAHTGSVVRKKCLEVGMNVVLHKPVDFAALPLKLREVIAASRLSAGTALPPDAAVPAGGSLDLEPDALAVLVAEVGLERAGTCVAAFLGETGTHMAELADHLLDRRWDALGRLAHSLSGLSSTLGAMALADGLLMLEDTARAEDADRAARVVQEVSATWDRTKTALRAEFDAVSARYGDPARKAA